LIDRPLRFGAADIEITARETVYRGYFSVEAVNLKHRLFAGGWSDVFRRECFHRGDAVGVLPWDIERDELILIEQFRVGALRADESPWMLELIAGVVEPNESDIDVVHREAQEEAACLLDQVTPIATYYPSAGACSEQIRLFVGRMVSAGVGETHGLDSEHEDIWVHAIPRTQAIALLDAGVINNGHTLIALQWLARCGDRLREQWRIEQ
jgi:ADP-ribose pyrophosphatase